MLGPHRGGRVLAVSGVPGNPRVFYFGSVGGGVWKTDNAGVTWVPLFDGAPVASIGALAVAPSDPQVLYVGTGEADMRSDISFGNGVYRSADGGAHWAHVGLEDSRHIGKILVDPHDPDVVLVAALGHAYGPNSERGVFRSADGGHTWVRVLYTGDSTGAIDLARAPDSGALYAALWQTRRPPWSQYPPIEGSGSGLYRSADGGRSWTAITGRGLPDGPLGRIGIATAAGSRVYALVETRGGTRLYRSEDAGATWHLTARDPRFSRTWYFGQVFVDPSNAGIVYVPDVALLRSTDGGVTFTAFKGQPGGDDYHALWIDPTAPERMIVGCDQGAVITLDGGETWSSWYNQPTGQFYHVSTDHEFPYWIFGAQQDAGSVSIRSRSDYGELTFRDWAPTGAGESGYIAPDPLDSNIIYGGDIYGGVLRFDRRTGETQNVSPWPESEFAQAMPDRTYRATWTSPLVFDRADPRTLYLGTQFLLATRDGGLHWDTLSPDLTGARPSAPDTGAVSVATAASRGYGVIYTVAPSPLEPGVIWVGTDDGLISVTADGGRSWRDVTPEGLAPWSKMSLLESSPLDTGTAYVAVDRHRLDDLRPYIYRTTDRGRHWMRIDRGIAATAYVHVVRADPRRRGLLYAGTETGVYVSFDNGDTWEPLQLNLPVAPVHDLAVKDGDLIAATHGRGFWVLDDLAPLETLPDDALGPLHLFAPRPAVRLRRTVNNDTPLPPEEPHGENPPAGAAIDYYLGAPSGPVTLEIADTTGQLVHRWSSADRFAPPTEPPPFTNDWLPRPESLSARPGLNRFVWNLRYPAPPTDEPNYGIAAVTGQGTVTEPQGPLVLPGRYRVTLRTGGANASTWLTVQPDPRQHVALDALNAQLQLALDIGRALGEEHAVREAERSTRLQLDSLPAGRLSEGLHQRVLELRAAIDTLDRGLGRAGGELGDVETAVESADREAPAQASIAFAATRRRLGAWEARWEAIRTQTLPAVSRDLVQEGFGPLPVGGNASAP
jgi:photosystem II stability/assembly factor-like uncharacterized protein